MRRAGQPPRAILSASGNARVSFECDLIDRPARPQYQSTTAGHSGRFSLPAVERTEPLSSSAPSALFLYQPFSSDKGPPSPLVRDVDRPQSRKEKAVGGLERFDSTTTATVTTKTAVGGGGREERTRLVPLMLTTNENASANADDNGFDYDRDNNDYDDVTTKAQVRVVPQEQTSVQHQQQSARASTKAMTTATTAPSSTMTAPSRASLLSSSSTAEAPSSRSETVMAAASTTVSSLAPTVSCLSNSSTRADSKTKTSSQHRQSTKEQRRQSSEDGLTTPTTHDLAIPTKCRMVFHMRDEVSKVKGHCTNGNQQSLYRAADGGSANFRPLPQPRQWQSVPQYPLRTTTSLKTTKTVSFQEPEPWRKRCSEEITSTSFVLTKEGDEASQQPTIMVTRPTFESEHGDNHQPIVLTSEKAVPTARAKTEYATTATATATTNAVTRPPPASCPALRSSAAKEHRGHARNLSAPSPSAASSMTQRTMETKPLPMATISTSNSSNSCNYSIDNCTGKGSPPTSSGGNRFSRLWKSMAQKVGSGHSHRHPQDENSGYPTNKLHHHHIHHSQNVQGSDLEPLVVNAQ